MVDVLACVVYRTFLLYGGAIIKKGFKDNRVQKETHIINEDIRAKSVLVIGPNGEQVGVRNTSDALVLAQTAGFDLVLVSPNANPPVCRIMDFGKFRYEQQRKSKEAKKNQKHVQNKEIRLTPVTDIHDIETKARNGRKFLEKGNKLKVSVFFRGRQMEHKELGKKVLDTFLQYVEDIAEVETPAKMEGRYMSMYLQPKK